VQKYERQRARAGISGILPAQSETTRIRILLVGDSITEGGASFSVYRYPLWKKLVEAKYPMIFVGTKSAGSPDGALAHEGYSGRNVEFIAERIAENFPKTPADIVLLHAGHNYAAEENPIPRILAATESMIATFRKVNPRVAVLVARPITSTKLPKYAYISALGLELDRLAKRLDTSEQPVMVVDQSSGFDPRQDTVNDLVHPNAAGAKKMAERWFEALEKILKK
jgi:lysophospholipase L1-like esterase